RVIRQRVGRGRHIIAREERLERRSRIHGRGHARGRHRKRLIRERVRSIKPPRAGGCSRRPPPPGCPLEYPVCVRRPKQPGGGGGGGGGGGWGGGGGGGRRRCMGSEECRARHVVCWVVDTGGRVCTPSAFFNILRVHGPRARSQVFRDLHRCDSAADGQCRT